MEAIGDPQSFVVTSAIKPSLPTANPQEVAAFYQQVESLSRSVRGAANRSTEALEEIAEINKALKGARIADLSLLEQTLKLENQLRDLRKALIGDRIRDRFAEPAIPSIQNQLGTAGSGRGTTYGPTKTHRQQFEIASERFGEIHGNLQKQTGEEMDKLFDQLEKAGVPWTKGRPIPNLR